MYAIIETKGRAAYAYNSCCKEQPETKPYKIQRSNLQRQPAKTGGTGNPANIPAGAGIYFCQAGYRLCWQRKRRSNAAKEETGMKRQKNMLSPLLHPPAAVAIPLTLFSAAVLLAVFTQGLDRTLLAYAGYLLSSYTLLIIAIACIARIRRLKRLLTKYKYGKLYQNSPRFRVKISLYISFTINLCYAVFKLITGIFYGSFWFDALAVYYLTLCVVRFRLLCFIRRDNCDFSCELREYRACGRLLFLLNLALTGVIYQSIHDGNIRQYPGYTIYAVAVYAFYCLTSSILNMVRFRKLKSPLLSASKTINLATALLTIFSLQTAMFASFGGEETFQRTMNLATGSAVCLCIFCMAIYMTVHASRQLGKQKANTVKSGKIPRAK